MRAPSFWWNERSSLAARLLSPAGAVFGAVTARRMAREGVRASVPVICVGNLVAGGAGKTPTALAVASYLAEAGERPIFLTRGYGGRLPGPVLVDPGVHTAADVGDEPLLLARKARTVVARVRPEGAAFAAGLGASVIVMDDGLQNPSLHKDLVIAVIDGATGIGNGLCIPAGPLRAPFERQLPYLDAAVVIGEGLAGRRVALEARTAGIDVETARILPDPEAAAALRSLRVLAFAGIGRPEKFFATLAACGATVVEALSFPDHHAYDGRTLQSIVERAQAGSLVAVTTEKDAARFETDPEVAVIRSRIGVLPIRLEFDQPALVERMLLKAFVRHAEPGVAGREWP